MNELDAINVLHVSKIADIINSMKQAVGINFRNDLCSKDENVVRGVSENKGIEINYNGDMDTVEVSYYVNEDGMWNKLVSINTFPKADFNGVYTYSDLIYHSQITDKHGNEVDMFTYEDDTHSFFDSIRDKTMSYDELKEIEHNIKDAKFNSMREENQFESYAYAGSRAR